MKPWLTRYLIPLVMSFTIFIALSYYVAPDSIMEKVILENSLRPPSLRNPLGTDALGRDVLLMLVAGIRNSLLIAFISITISASIGVILGVLSPMYRLAHILDNVMIYLNTIPTLFVVALVALRFGVGFHNVVLACVLVLVPLFYRISKTVSTTVLTQPYIEAAKALGASDIHILVHHLIPEVLPYMITLYIFSIPTSIALEMSLTFIGIGLDTSTPSLGVLLYQGIYHVFDSPYIIIASTITSILILISLTAISNAFSKKVYALQT